MATILKKRVMPSFGFGLPQRTSILQESELPAKAKGKSKPKSDHPAFEAEEAESDPEPNESDEEWGNKGLLQPPTRPFTILSNRASGLPSSPARLNGLPGSPARRVPGQSTGTPLRPPYLPPSSSALGRPPLQPRLPAQEFSPPPSQPQSQVPSDVPVVSSHVQTPTVFVSHSRSPPSDDPPQLPWTQSPVPSEDLLRPSRPPSPETPAFDIIDAYDYIKRATLEQVVMPESISPTYVAPPFTYTNALREGPIAEDGEDESSDRRPVYGEETSPPLLHLQPPSERAGPVRDSQDVDPPTPKDDPSPPVAPPKDLPRRPRVEAQQAPRRLPEIVQAPSSVQSPETISNPLYLGSNTGTPRPLALAINIATPTVPPVPPPIGPVVVGGAKASHRRYTPLSIPGEILSPGDEFSPVTRVGLARTPRTANFDVIMFGMGEDRVERLESATGSERLETFNVSAPDSVPMRREMKVQPPQESVGSEVDVLDIHLVSQGRGDFDTSAVLHDGRPEEYDEDDEEFEMIIAVDVAKLKPPGDLDSESDRDVESGVVRTAVEVSLSSAVAPLPPQRPFSSSNDCREVEDDGWYPRLPTDGVVDVVSKNQGKPKPNPVSIPVPEVKEITQGRDITLKGPGILVKNRPPPIRPPRPPSLGFDLRMLDGMSGEEEMQIERFRQFEGRWEQQERSGALVSQSREVSEPGNVGTQPASVSEPVQVSLPMRKPAPPSPFSPLTITLDTVSFSDMLRASTAPAAPQLRLQGDFTPVVSPKEARKEPSGSALRPASGRSDILGLEEALSWKPAPVKPPVEPVTSPNGGQGEFGKWDLGRNFATMQGGKREFGSSSPHPITLPTPNKPAFGPTTPMPPDTPLYHPTQSVLPTQQILTKSVFERGDIQLLNTSAPRPPTSMPLDMLPILPPVPRSSPPRPKHAAPAVRNPKSVRTPPAPEYGAPSPPHTAPYNDLRKDVDVSFRGPWASAPSNLASLEPVAGGGHPPIAPPPHLMPQGWVKYHPRGSSLLENEMQTSSQGQSSGFVEPPPNGHVQPSPPNDLGMDQITEGVTRSYYENVSSETSPFPPASRKEKKKQPFAGVVSALKKLNKKAKAAKYGLASIEEHGPPRVSSERGRAEQERKQNAPGQPAGQAYMSPPPVLQQLPPAFNFPSQSLPAQGLASTSRDAQQIGGDGWGSREQPAATSTGIFATDDVQGQPVPYKQDEVNTTTKLPPRMRASEDTSPSYVSLSHRPVVTAPPPLVYFPSVPIATHVACISTRLEAERDNAISGGDPIPSLNTTSIPQIISSLSRLNASIGEACAVLTNVIVSSRVATGEPDASSGGVDTRRMSAKVERDMHTRACEFLTGGIFGRFSVALDSEEDRALREAHGEVFVRYPQLLSARWRVLACTSTAPSPDTAPTILDSLLRTGVGAVLGNSNPNSKLVYELSTLLRPVFCIALELSTRLHVDMIEHDYGVFSGTPVGGVVDLHVEESKDPSVFIPLGARVGGFWSLGLRRAKWEGSGDERKRITEVLVKPRVYVENGSKFK